MEANLPELGLKDVVPNGSWLEQKQIQASLEAKKHLIEVERIEKRYSLTHFVLCLSFSSFVNKCKSILYYN